MSRIAPDSRRSLPEMSNFARTCSMLSHYLKEMGSPRDLNLGINGKVDQSFPVRSEEAAVKTTIDFLSEKPIQLSTQNVKPINLFPQYITTQDCTGNNNSSEQVEAEPKNGQMTIFYAGKILVFDEFCAAKAKELIQLANNGVTSNSTCEYVGVQNEMKPQLQSMESDLPIARKASLHRFLSKRKNRAIARGPYQLQKPSVESGKELLFDLNL